LVEIGSSCVDMLIDGINSEKSTKTRDNLVRTLGDIMDARVNSALIEIVRNDADTGIRSRAIERLGYLRETKAVKPIIEHIEKLKESVPLFSHVPIRALGMIGDPSAIDILIDLFRSNRSSYSQVNFLKNLAVALEKLGWKPEPNSTDMAFFVMAIGEGGLKQTIEKLIAIGKKATEPLVLIRDYLSTLKPEDTSHGGLTFGQVYGYDNTSLFKMIESYLSD
jgi:HEAT repeat protein